MEELDGMEGYHAYMDNMEGGIQNRLEKTYVNLQVKKENLAQSKSRIKDVDVAEAAADLNKGRLKSQLSTNLLIGTNQKDRMAVRLI